MVAARQDTLDSAVVAGTGRGKSGNWDLEGARTKMTPDKVPVRGKPAQGKPEPARGKPVPVRGKPAQVLVEGFRLVIESLPLSRVLQPPGELSPKGSPW